MDNTEFYNIRMALLDHKGKWCFESKRYHQKVEEFLQVLYSYCPGEGIVLFQVWDNEYQMNDTDPYGIIDSFAGPVEIVRERLRELLPQTLEEG